MLFLDPFLKTDFWMFVAFEAADSHVMVMVGCSIVYRKRDTLFFTVTPIFFGGLLNFIETGINTLLNIYKIYNFTLTVFFSCGYVVCSLGWLQPQKVFQFVSFQFLLDNSLLILRADSHRF